MSEHVHGSGVGLRPQSSKARSPVVHLLKLKARGYVRGVRRRLATPRGFEFGLLGTAAIGLWLVTLVLRTQLGAGLDPDLAPHAARVVLTALVLLTAFASISYRGVYFPPSELERLLSSPLSRQELVRYRMLVNCGRSLGSGIFMGIVFAPRMPHNGFAFVGIMVSLVTLPSLGQIFMLLSGELERRFRKSVMSGRLRYLRALIPVGFLLLFLAMFFAEDFEQFALPAGGLAGFIRHPIVEALSLPAAPWGLLISATTWGVFLPVLFVCLALSVFLFELAARMPLDFREMSLETSADVARRLRRLGSGRGVIGAGKVSKRSLTWDVPWLFGKSPVGSVAWRQFVTIVRRARAAVTFYVVVLMLAIFLTLAPWESGGLDPTFGGLVVSALAVLYLSLGLRFDFRADLDRVETIKAWPLAPWRLFLATILPEAALVSTLAVLGVLLRTLIAGDGWPEDLSLVLACTPPGTLLWIALDNTAFLLFPVRYAPGQPGGLQHTGRALIVLFGRIAATLAFFGAVGGGMWLAHEAVLAGGGTISTAALAGVLVAGLVTILSLVGILMAGGWALRRHDPSSSTTRFA